MPPCATGPAPSRGVRVTSVTVILTLALLGALLELLVCLLKLFNLYRKLSECTNGLFIKGCTTMLALAESLLEFTVLVILVTVGRVMRRMSAPMLLA